MSSLPPAQDCRRARLELVPSLEFEPGHIAPDLLRGPDFLGAKLWHEAMAHAGLGDLPALVPGSWFVATREMTDLGLKALLDRHFANYSEALDPSKTDEELPPLAASFGLELDGSVLSIPSCCTDLGDLTLWRDAAGGTDTPLWIGHMTLTGVRVAEGLDVSLVPEYPNPREVRRWLFGNAQLDAAIGRAEAAVTRFSAQLESVVAKLIGAERASQVTAILIARSHAP